MILKRLTLDNYCLFAGHHEFDLAPRTKYGSVRPIILFGGKNGAGKTTILSAIHLAFYGRQSLGDRLSEKEYHLALRNRIHRNKENDRRASFAKVALEFDLVTQGEKHEYRIERSWTSGENSNFLELFKVERNGKVLEDISREHLQSFVADIVPERLSQLFFFDGEKIKSIAEDISSNAAISDAIQTLLGFDVVKSLQSDLATHRSRVLKEGNPAGYDAQLSAFDAELAQLNESKAELITRERNLKTVIAGIESEIAQLQKHLSEKGGTYAASQSTNAARAAELEGRRRSLITQARAESDTSLPLTLCPTLTQRLVTELDAECAVRSFRLLDAELSSLQNEVLASATQELPASQTPKFTSFLKQQLARYLEARRPTSSAVELHALSERDAALTVECLTKQAPASAARLHSILTELDGIERELRTVNADLERVPEQLILRDTFEELNARNQDLGRQLELKRQVTDKLHQTEIDITAKARQKAKAASELAKAENVATKVALIGKIDTALDLYMARLTQAKIAQLQSEVTECYNRLARKSDFIHRIEISPETFSVAVIDKLGRSIPKEDLSSGEKQIFAISMLWGLARTSGRPLPVVIDTPLGRLDSDHRKNLINNYFPHASHQVILLSTDTEVDLDLFEELHKSKTISHCYRLEYDHTEICTKVVPDEYFWRQPATA